MLKSDYTFTRPNRRSWSMPGGIILPGQKNDTTVKVHCCIDTSGSMTDEMLREFLSEVKGIMTQFKDFELYLWTFDTRVYNFQKFTMANANDIDSYVPGGGGGTSFEVNFDFMKENQIVPDRFVMFTDGYPNDSWGDPNYCDSLFIVYGQGAPKSPYGQTVPYERLGK
jgi:predicted metal-dependent peptidase